MVSWNVPAHGMFGCQRVTLVDDRSTGRVQLISTSGPTREWARLRQRRDHGRKVTGVRNDEGAGDGLPSAPSSPGQFLNADAPVPGSHLGLRGIRYAKRADPANKREHQRKRAQPRPQCDGHG